MRIRTWVSASTLAVLSCAAFAHHSPAAYDMQSSRLVEGAITEYEWGNPHVYLSVRESASGTVWVVEAFASTAMKQYGWAADTFAIGDQVVVGGNPGRNAARPILFLRSVRKAVGWSIELALPVFEPIKVLPGGFELLLRQGRWIEAVVAVSFNDPKAQIADRLNQGGVRVGPLDENPVKEQERP